MPVPKRVHAQRHVPTVKRKPVEQNPVSSPALETTNAAPENVLRLQNVVGNRAVQRLIQRAPAQRRAAPPVPEGVRNVREALGRADFMGRPRQGQPGNGPWGAYYYLQQMNPTELLDTLNGLTVAERALLLNNIAQANNVFDTDRLQIALRSVAGRDVAEGRASVTIDDAIGTAQAQQAIIDQATRRAVAMSDAIRKAQEASSGVVGTVTEWFDRNVTDVRVNPFTPVFQMLSGLDNVNIQETVRRLSASERSLLLANLSDADGQLQASLQPILTNVQAGRPVAPTVFLNNPFAGAFAPLVGETRAGIYKKLRLLSRQNRQTLLANVAAAPAAERDMIREVLQDLQGAGTDMSSSDLIDLNGIRGSLNRRMAGIYNNYGQYLEEQARGLNISSAAAAGIMKAESGGETFSEATNRPLVRFENHVFWNRWGSSNRATFNQHFQFNREGQVWTGHLWRPTATGEWQSFHGDQTREWQVINFAASLSARETAYDCMSIGAGQVMGFNAEEKAGYNGGAVEMYEAFARGERPQLGAIFNFIRNTDGLAAAVRRGDYLELARRYNGGGQAAAYAAVISEAADAYNTVTRGKEHVFPEAAAPAAR